ncbi:MAG: hypothetical protein EZS28_009971 [Streblomastix strix]|uniref:DDE-1 domain-containing protein n=1 Tax=Streblomastix strix TaxID=222440 RepID=A0A5J4WIH6_9EUKA|nr:MAG: hypothetical protein EZS28_009971 [Streblomastix strix]
MCKGNDVTSEKKQALYASNIKHWNNKIYTLDIAKGVRPRCFVNMDETEINAENDALVAKIRGLKRSLPAGKEKSPGQITYAMSVSNCPHQLPQMYVASGLKKVSQRFFTPNERIILLLDGHPSRKDSKAA